MCKRDRNALNKWFDQFPYLHGAYFDIQCIYFCWDYFIFERFHIVQNCFITITYICSLSVGYSEMRKVSPLFLSVEALFRESALNTHSSGNDPLWCHEGQWYLSQVSANTPGQVLILSSETISCPPCLCPLVNMWKVQRSIIFSRKLKPSVFLQEAVNRLEILYLKKKFLKIKTCVVFVSQKHFFGPKLKYLL